MVNSGAREAPSRVSSSCFYKTHAMLLAYIVKSGESLDSDRGKKTSTNM
jgi:hypothetical protein